MMKHIWLIRHAESKSQVGETDDHINPALSDLGRRQAQRLIKRLAGLNPDRTLISPLRRAWQTYELSGTITNQVEFDSRLIESNWGNLQVYREILPVITPDLAEPDRHDAWLMSDSERTKGLLKDILKWDVENILLFGHWGSFHHLLLSFFETNASNNPFRAIMDNASVSLLEVDDNQNRFLRYWNDHSHVLDLLEKM
jgi:broad specificity phosphatase PhoE